MLRRLETETSKFGFIKQVDINQIMIVEDLEICVLSVNSSLFPSDEVLTLETSAFPAKNCPHYRSETHHRLHAWASGVAEASNDHLFSQQFHNRTRLG